MIRRTAGGEAAFRVTAPGILRSAEGDEVLVVMWVDEGFRTAAVGAASGRWAAVIDRGGKASPDRTRAAVEILDFNGWDVSRLQRVQI